MESTKTKHLINLLIADSNVCTAQIQSINQTDYADSSKDILTGYFRDRRNLNTSILEEMESFDEKNINNQTPVEDVN
jgi:hypothetical protein